MVMLIGEPTLGEPGQGAQGPNSPGQERMGVVSRLGEEGPRTGLGVWVEWVLDHRLRFALSSEGNSWDRCLGWGEGSYLGAAI